MGQAAKGARQTWAHEKSLLAPPERRKQEIAQLRAQLLEAGGESTESIVVNPIGEHSAASAAAAVASGGDMRVI